MCFSSKPHSTKCAHFCPHPPISLFLSPRRWCCRRAPRSGGSSRTVTSDLHPKLCHQVQCQLSLGSSRAPTLADKHKLCEKKKRNTTMKKNFITRYSTIKLQYKRIKRVMDAPTYSLNQKLNINKNIYGNFHSLLYVSILVPFCPFSSRFFLWLRHGTVHWQTEMADSVWTINKISVFGVNVVHVWKDTVLV